MTDTLREELASLSLQDTKWCISQLIQRLETRDDVEWLQKLCNYQYFMVDHKPKSIEFDNP